MDGVSGTGVLLFMPIPMLAPAGCTGRRPTKLHPRIRCEDDMPELGPSIIAHIIGSNW